MEVKSYRKSNRRRKEVNGRSSLIVSPSMQLRKNRSGSEKGEAFNNAAAETRKKGNCNKAIIIIENELKKKKADLQKKKKDKLKEKQLDAQRKADARKKKKEKRELEKKQNKAKKIADAREKEKEKRELEKKQLDAQRKADAREKEKEKRELEKKQLDAQRKANIRAKEKHKLILNSRKKKAQEDEEKWEEENPMNQKLKSTVEMFCQNTGCIKTTVPKPPSAINKMVNNFSKHVNPFSRRASAPT